MDHEVTKQSMFILVPDIISSKLTVSVPSGTANGSDLNTTMKSVVFPGVSTVWLEIFED